MLLGDLFRRGFNGAFDRPAAGLIEIPRKTLRLSDKRTADPSPCARDDLRKKVRALRTAGVVI
jgi:hypothetical protein